jgi:type II secretory pathway component PulK
VICTAARTRSGQDGFVLLSVLIVTTVLSAIALGAALSVRAASRSTDAELQLIEARSLADAALTRALAALEDPDDPLSDVLRSAAGPVRWTYAGTEIALSLQREAGKVDLNAGHPEMIRRLIAGLASDASLADRMLKRLQERRSRRQAFERVSALIEPAERLSPLALRLDETFTVLSGARGIDPLAAPEAVLRAVPGITEADLVAVLEARGQESRAKLAQLKARFSPWLDGERPLFRVQARVRSSLGLISTREGVMALDLRDSKVSTVHWADRASGNIP